MNCAIIVGDEALGKRLEEFGFRVVSNGVFDSLESLTGFIERECRGVVVAGRSAWSFYLDLYGFLRRRGFNPFGVVAVDSVIEPRLAGVEPLRFVVARFSSHMITRYSSAGYRVDSSRRVSRRDLLRRGVSGLRFFVNTPLLVSPSACSSLKYCRECVSACPFGALEGKPPVVVVDRCTGCGACLSSCPLRLLESSGVSRREVYSFLKSIVGSLKERGLIVVFMCVREAPRLVEALREAVFRSSIVIVPVFCLGEVVFDVIASIVAGGGGVVVYCSEGSSECRGEEVYREGVLEAFSRFTRFLRLASSVEDVLAALKELDSFTSAFDSSVFDQSLASVFRSVSNRGVGEVGVGVPVPVRISVDSSVCDLCGACVYECPTGALRIEEEGDSQRLIYRPGSCIGCRACEVVCPHSALRAERILPVPLEDEIVLARDEVARCIVCGRPIGSKRLVESVARRLREAGFSEEIVRTAYMCNECKMRYRLGLVEPRDSSRFK